MPRKPKAADIAQRFDVRLDEDGTLDDVAIIDGHVTVRLERQSGRSWWMRVDVGGRSLDVWFSSEKRINTSFVEDEV